MKSINSFACDVKQRFGIRKLKVGACSALLTALISTGSIVSAQHQNLSQPASSELVTPSVSDVVEDLPAATDVQHEEIRVENKPRVPMQLESFNRAEGASSEAGVGFNDDMSKWSVVSYRIDPSRKLNSDKIIIDNPYTNVKLHNGKHSMVESTELEAQQFWETIFEDDVDGNTKVVASDLNPNHAELRESFTGFTDDKTFYSFVLRVNNSEIWYLVTNMYSSVNPTISKDPVSMFGETYKISYQQFAQIKAAKMRADVAYETLKRIAPSDPALKDYDTIVEYYDRAKLSFDSLYNADYMPQIIVDNDAWSTDGQNGFTREEHQEIIDSLKKLPLPLRQVALQIRVQSDATLRAAGRSGVAGLASTTRLIRLNSRYNGTLRTLYHEMGHLIDFTSSERNSSYRAINSLSRTPEFQAMWKVAFAKSNSYYRDSFEEGFADGFADWMMVRYEGEDAAQLEKSRPGVLAYFDKIMPQLIGPNSEAVKHGGSPISTTTDPVVTEPVEVVNFKADINLDYGIRKFEDVNGRRVTIVGIKPVRKTLKVGKFTIVNEYTFKVDPDTGKVETTTTQISKTRR